LHDRQQTVLIVHPQADAAASGAAGVMQSLLDGQVGEPGAWMPEQVIGSGHLFSRLAARGLNVLLTEQQNSPIS
jgi:hypothetical protein